MSGSLRLALILLAVVFAGYFAIALTKAIVGWVLSLIIPILFVGVVVGVLYMVVNRKALGGGRRLLP